MNDKWTFNEGELELEPEPPVAADQAGQGVHLVLLNALYPNPNNPRKKFDQDELDKLTDSVRQVGILSPILVVRDDEQYRIVAGERRYRAAKAAGLTEVPVLIRELTPEQEFEIMMIENIQREDLDPIDEAIALKMAVNRGWKQTELAERLGISQAQIANRIRLLKLPQETREYISHEIISPGHGLALVKVAHMPDATKHLAKVFYEENTSVAAARDRVDFYIQAQGKPLYQANWGAPIFDYQKTCIDSKCPYCLSAKSTYEAEKHFYCMKSECWNEHQNAAHKQVIEEKLDATNGNGDAPLKTEDLEWGGYQRFTPYTPIKPEECSGCKDLKEAISSFGDAVTVCLNPECWGEKTRAKVREKAKATKEKKKSFEDTKDRILEMVKFHGRPNRKHLTYMAVAALCEPVRATSWTYEKIWEAAYEFFGWPGGEYTGWRNEEMIQDLIAHLDSLEEEKLWQVILFGLFRGLEPDDPVYQLTLGMSRKNEQMEEIPDA